MTARELANKLMEYPDFNVKFSDFHQEFPGGPVVDDTWTNIDITDIAHSDKTIVLGGEVE